MTPREMYERAWTIVNEARNAWNEACKQDGGPTAEQDAALDAGLAEAKALEERADRLKKVEETEKRMNEPTFRPTPQAGRDERPDGLPDLSHCPESVRDYLVCFAAQSKAHRNHVRVTCSPEYRRAIERYLTVPDISELTPDERRGLSEGVDTEGGFLVPADIDASMILRDAREPAVVRSLATVQTTVRDRKVLKSGDRISIGWVGEKEGAPEQNTDFGEIEWVIQKLLAITKITQEEIEDAAFDVIRYLGEVYDESSAFEEDKAFIAGNGAKKPIGILHGNRVTRVDSLNIGSLVDNDILTVFYKLPARYRRNATWLFESAIELEIAKLKDSEGRWLWQPGLTADRPPTVRGRPVANPDEIMDSTIAAGKEIAIFGDIGRYHIYDRIGTSVQRLNERYAETDEIGFKVRKRVGGNVAVANGLRVLRVKA